MFAINYNGGASFKGPYNDDTDAAANGIAVGKYYYTGTGGLIYGYPEGSLRVRTS